MCRRCISRLMPRPRGRRMYDMPQKKKTEKQPDFFETTFFKVAEAKSFASPLTCKKCGKLLRVYFSKCTGKPAVLFCSNKCYSIDFDLAAKVLRDAKPKNADRAIVLKGVESALRRSGALCPKCHGEILVRVKGKRQDVSSAVCQNCGFEM